jgi:hypothetical protein
VSGRAENGAFSTTGPHDDTQAASKTALASFDRDALRADLTLSEIIDINCFLVDG